MIETPLGLLNVRDIAGLAAARRSRRLAGLVLGTNDIAKDTGVQPGPDRAPLVPWLLQAVLVARAYGLFVLDGVFNAFADSRGLRARMCPGPTIGLRRQDADPPVPDRMRQPPLRAQHGGGGGGARHH